MWDYLKLAGLGLVAVLAAIAANYAHDLAYQVNAITVMLALGGAFILSLTFVPAMVALLIRGEVAEKDVKAVALAKERYVPLLDKAVARPCPWIGAGIGAFVLAGLVFLMWC